MKKTKTTGEWNKFKKTAEIYVGYSFKTQVHDLSFKIYWLSPNKWMKVEPFVVNTTMRERMNVHTKKNSRILRLNVR